MENQEDEYEDEDENSFREESFLKIQAVITQYSENTNTTKSNMRLRLRMIPEGSGVLRMCRCARCYKENSSHWPGCPETKNTLRITLKRDHNLYT